MELEEEDDAGFDGEDGCDGSFPFVGGILVSELNVLQNGTKPLPNCGNPSHRMWLLHQLRRAILNMPMTE